MCLLLFQTHKLAFCTKITSELCCWWSCAPSSLFLYSFFNHARNCKQFLWLSQQLLCLQPRWWCWLPIPKRSGEPTRCCSPDGQEGITSFTAFIPSGKNRQINSWALMRETFRGGVEAERGTAMEERVQMDRSAPNPIPNSWRKQEKTERGWEVYISQLRPALGGLSEEALCRGRHCSPSPQSRVTQHITMGEEGG